MSDEMEVLEKIIEQEGEDGKPQTKSRAFAHHQHFQRAIEYHKEWAGLLNDPPKFDFVVLQSHRDDLGLESSYANYARKFAGVIHD